MPGLVQNKMILPKGPLAVVFMDLDDSIFQTLRKCPDEPLEAAALDRGGHPSSYFSFSQRCLLELFSRQTIVVPTTARNRAAFGRVRFKFNHGAILNYGGLILRPDGQIDESWHDRMKPLCEESAPLLAEVMALADKTIRDRGLNCQARIIGDHGLDFYVVVKNYYSRPQELNIIMDEMKKFHFTPEIRIHLNDNNLSLRPHFLDKSEAVTYFRQSHIVSENQNLPLIGMGDSFSDLEFMRSCNFMLLPGGSQAAALLSGAEEEGA
ncbi:hypothetical protein C4J81_13885 [Deltaproteobacteria bacterium Smac51]|nr:hypothetical protein C4J81_13885 [Deltaproteobacteria bacterium Smac51]